MKLPNCINFLILILSSNVQIVTSQSLDATLLELKFSNDGYPERLVKVDNGFFLSAEDDRLWFSDGTIENTYLVKDFNSGIYDDISALTASGTKVFFVAEQGSDNRELWVSDGTEEGTIQLTDRNVSYSTENIDHIIEFNGKIYFGAYSEIYGNELWVSDGTPEGTYVFKDIADNEANSFPRDFYVFDDKLFFKAYTEEYNTELWVSDGTEQGTILFKDINVGGDGGVSTSYGYIAYGQNFYFFANDGATGMELWKSDGTPDGTQLLKDINPGYSSSYYNKLLGVALSDKLIFGANNGNLGYELWMTDGTEEGTSIVTDLLAGDGSGLFYDAIIEQIGDKIFFTGVNGLGQLGLWISDGTEQGTNFLIEHSPSLISVNNIDNYAIYFASNGNGQSVLWKSDGTPEGTLILSEDVEVTNTSVADQSFLLYDNRIFFNGDNEVNGKELWVTNGTSEGTELFKDFNHSYGANPSNFSSIGEKLFFRANQYGNYELCVSDGTIEGTQYVDVGPEGLYLSDDVASANFNGNIILNGYDGISGFELWISDGTMDGTHLVKDIKPGSGSGFDNNGLQTFTVINNVLYFYADDGVYGNELWRSDGTEAGTYMLKNIRQNDSSAGGSYPNQFCVLNDLIYFIAQGDPLDAIWQTDGTAEGTTKVIDLDDLRVFRKVNDKLIFFADSSGSSYGPHDLWVSDGTEAGTMHLMSFGDGINSTVRQLAVLNDELFFKAKNPETFGFSLYKTDGTLSGTIEIHDNEPDIIRTCGDYLYFRDSAGLWRTDGISVVNVSSDEVYAETSTCYQNSLIYRFDDDNSLYYPKKLKITNDNISTPILLDIDVNNGNNLEGNDAIYRPFAQGDKLFFRAGTYASGQELYVTMPYLMTSDNPEDDVDSDGILNFLDLCPNTPDGEPVDVNGCSQSQLDDDEDGVMNNVDQCPDTPNGEVVNVNGCSDYQLSDDDNDGVLNYIDLCPDSTQNSEVDANGCFTLSSDNYSIQVLGETCTDSNNGQIIINTNEPYNYVLTLNGETLSFNSILTIDSLNSGDYSICITIVEETNYEQCFNLVVEEAAEISGRFSTGSGTNRNTTTIEMISGTKPFKVSLNAIEIFQTNSNVFDLDVSNGDLISVSSKYACEGKLEQRVTLNNDIIVFPNPTSNDFEIIFHNNDLKEVSIELYNELSQLISYKSYPIENGKIRISLNDMPIGIYLGRIYLNEKTRTFKIIKK